MAGSLGSLRKAPTRPRKSTPARLRAALEYTRPRRARPRAEGALNVSICCATYKRPDGLKRLLEALARLRFERVEAPALEVVVVDNEAAGRARAICSELEPGFPWRLRCEEEPRQGITYARNRGLDCALPGADFVAFIDDDEVPEPGWLDALMRAQQRHAADVVSGPVRSTFGPEIPEWVRKGGFFRPRALADGARLEIAFTHNALVSAGLFLEIGRFDDRFAHTGGEDTDFFMRAHRAGRLMVWAADAVVEEAVPLARASTGWILRRGYREWSSHSFSEKEQRPGLRTRAERVAKASTLILAGCATLPFSALLGKHRSVRSLLLVARGVGSLAGLLGSRYQEYRAPG
jgi:GT2 family glycosyltransferase